MHSHVNVSSIVWKKKVGLCNTNRLVADCRYPNWTTGIWKIKPRKKRHRYRRNHVNAMPSVDWTNNKLAISPANHSFLLCRAIKDNLRTRYRLRSLRVNNPPGDSIRMNPAVRQRDRTTYQKELSDQKTC